EMAATYSPLSDWSLVSRLTNLGHLSVELLGSGPHPPLRPLTRLRTLYLDSLSYGSFSLCPLPALEHLCLRKADSGDLSFLQWQNLRYLELSFLPDALWV